MFTAPKLSKLLTQLFFTLFLLTSSIPVYSQTDLVRWNNLSTPTPEVSHITAGAISSAGGVTIENHNWSGYRINGFNNNNTDGNINYNKYIEFRISPNNGYKIAPSEFKFTYNSPSDNGSKRLQVRYSTDSAFPSNGILLGSEQILNLGSDQNITFNFPANYEVQQTLYVRVYLYGNINGWYTDFFIRNTTFNTSNQGPTIRGTVSSAVTGNPADLRVTKTMNNSTPVPGDNVTYTINVENLDASNTASGVIVTDQLPGGFSYVSSTSPVGSYDSGTGVWTIGNLANGASVNLQIVAQMQSTGPYTNTATVSHNGNDPNSSNNSSSATPTNVCGGCTHSIPNGGGNINVGNGDIYCLHSGTFTGTFTLAAGGTICIASGATFSPQEPTTLDGTIINRGTMNFPVWTGNHSATIFNYGNFNPGGLIGLSGELINEPGAVLATNQITNFSGELKNYGTINNSGGTSFVAGGSMINIGTYNSTSIQNLSGELNNSGNLTITGNSSFLAGASIINTGQVNLNGISPSTLNVTNYNSFVVNGGVNINGGDWDNKLGATMLINMDTSGNNMNFVGNFDNSGLWRFASVSVLSGVVNNYGHLQIYNTVSDIASATYLTNDGLLEFINVPDIQFNGPMLTNNGEILVTHSTGGNFKMNQSINQVYNNGLIDVSGQFEQNAENSTLVNNCRIISNSFVAREGNATNNGIISAVQNVEIHGNSLVRNNTPNARIQGTNFDNDGVVRGYGTFYFTGTTDNSGGEVYGDSSSDPIYFYDSSLSSPSILFDIENGSLTNNVVRPASMSPTDLNSYACTAPASSAGFPPITSSFKAEFCEPVITTFDIHDYATANPNSPEASDPFVLLLPSIRFFEHNNPSNPTNNSTHLVIPGKGSLSVDTSTGIVTFTPDTAFTSGSFDAEYRISNKRSEDPVTYPSQRTGITFNIECDCYKDPNTEQADTFTSTGVSTLSSPSKSWPENVPNGFLALESKEKGFVITRVTNENTITEPKEGMIIYDIEARCIKLYNGTSWKCIQRKCN